MRRKLRFTNENLQVIENCKDNRVKKTFLIILLNPSNVIKYHYNVKYWNFLPELQTFTSYVLKQTGLNADLITKCRLSAKFSHMVVPLKFISFCTSLSFIIFYLLDDFVLQSYFRFKK